MPRTVAGFPFWEAAFDEEGKPQDPANLAQVITEIQAANLTDLFVFSHGWNNDRQTAQILYDGFFQQVRKLLDDARFQKQRPARCGIVGVFWPSILWPDEQPAGARLASGGAAALRTSPRPQSAGAVPLEDLRTVFGAAHDSQL